VDKAEILGKSGNSGDSTLNPKMNKALSITAHGHGKGFVHFKMVEAAGVEPASENTPLPYLHA